MQKLIDTEKFSAHLRRHGIDKENRRVLLTRFTGSDQERDLSLPANCGGFGRIHHFKRFQGVGWPPNPLPIDPVSHFFGQPDSDEIQVQVFQNAICSWRCWYCFVDFDLLSANTAHAEFKTVDELLDAYLEIPNRPQIIDLSGGQPDLVPEWSLWFSDLIRERELDKQIYLWSDDNLSNDYLWRYLDSHEVTRLVNAKNFGRVGCFKGFDEQSFVFNTAAESESFLQQFALMKNLVEAGFDVYGYATFTSDRPGNIRSLMRRFVDLLQERVHPLFPLRTVPLRIMRLTPTAQRMTPNQDDAIEIQIEAVAYWMEEIASRFSADMQSKKVYEHRLHGN